MKELVNLSNYHLDNLLINNSAEELQKFLREHNLSGLEMLFYENWDEQIHKKDFVKGVHLNFWPNWLDFWLDNKKALIKEYGDLERAYGIYGGKTKSDWLNLYQDNIIKALEAQPEYLVFHVAQARPSEVFHWNFNYDSAIVIEKSLEVLQELMPIIPANTKLLLENLWWPGLTLQKKDLVETIFTKLKYDNLGLILDTGHLMNTNANLKNQEEGVAYILETVNNLGQYKQYIYGIHLHHSLSGEYVKKHCNNNVAQDLSMENIMKHILKIDEHLPFNSKKIKAVVDMIQPQYLVHEFMQTSKSDWSQKITTQRKALGLL